MDAQNELTPEQLDAVSAGYAITLGANGRWMIEGLTGPVFETHQAASNHLWSYLHPESERG